MDENIPTCRSLADRRVRNCSEVYMLSGHTSIIWFASNFPTLVIALPKDSNIYNRMQARTSRPETSRTFPGPVGETKAVKDLEASTLQTICLATENLGISLVHDASFFDTTMRHPGCGHQAVVCRLLAERFKMRREEHHYPAGPAPMMSLNEGQQLQLNRIHLGSYTSTLDSGTESSEAIVSWSTLVQLLRGR